MIRSEAYRQLIDFDSHLDDVSRDWMNVALGKQIKAAVRAEGGLAAE